MNLLTDRCYDNFAVIPDKNSGYKNAPSIFIMCNDQHVFSIDSWSGRE